MAREMVDRLADPLLSGVYGGEAASLSVRAVLPRFAEMERKHGSLGRAMLAARKKMSAGPRKPAPPLFTSLKNGMQHLAETVVSRLTPSSLLTKAPVQAIQREAGSWVVSAGLQSDQFDGVIVALPAPAAADVLRMVSPELSAELAADPVQFLHHGGSRLRPRCARNSSSRLRISRAAQRRQATPGRNIRAQQIPASRSRRPCPAALLFRWKKCGGCLVSFPTIRSSGSSATNCSKSWACAPNLYSRVSTNGSPPWRNMALDISSASTASSVSASSCPALLSRATPTAASASPTVSAPAATPRIHLVES